MATGAMKGEHDLYRQRFPKRMGGSQLEQLGYDALMVAHGNLDTKQLFVQSRTLAVQEPPSC